MSEIERTLTEQEEFWRGAFGNDYADRNQGDQLLASNLHFFSSILRSCPCAVRSILEFGANIGMNLLALHHLLPDSKLQAVEINEYAATALRNSGVCEKVFQQSLLDFHPTAQYDFVLAKGILIHLHPDVLPIAYSKLYAATSRYLCLAEYYNPTPVEISYRGHAKRLFKRDFAGEILDIYHDLQLMDYGFAYRRDPHFPMDDVTWFLIEKRH